MHSRLVRALVLASAIASIAGSAAAQPVRYAAQRNAAQRAAQPKEIDAFIAKGVKDWEIPGLAAVYPRTFPCDPR